MGVAASSPVGGGTDHFKRRFLLINPPQYLATLAFDKSASNVVVEDNYAMSTSTLLRSVDAVIVSWSGRRLRAEQWLSVLGNHLVILYFFTPEVDVEETKDAEQIAREMKNAINEARSSSPKASILVLSPVSPQQPIVAKRDDGFQEEEVEAKEQEDAIDYEAITRNSGFRFHRIDEADAKGLFNLQAYLASFIVPMEMYRPLSDLLLHLREGCSATEAILVDSSSFLPLVASDEIPVRKDFSSRLASVCYVIRHRLQRMKDVSNSGDLSSLHLSLPGLDISVGWAVRGKAYVLLIREARGVPTTLRVGDGLTSKNIELMSRQFLGLVNSITPTSKAKRIKVAG